MASYKIQIKRSAQKEIQAVGTKKDRHRIVYEIQDDVLIIHILKVGHRKDVYR